MDYSSKEMAISPDQRGRVQAFIDEPGGNTRVVFSPEKIRVQLTPEALETLSSLNGNKRHSESRVLRKLLVIFMTDVSEGEDGASIA